MSSPKWRWWCAVLLILPAGLRVFAAEPVFRAGAHVTDISPLQFPVRVNAMFTERSSDRVIDPLSAKALVLDDGSTRIAFCVVDSCMVPRDLIDQAKDIASKATGIPIDRMMVSSTHTHSAPSAMGCLGSRVDPIYAASLPPRIAEAIVEAHRKLAPARIGWTSTNDWQHTFNRRWIRRPDRLINDPFGQPTVRAHMHPGHVSPDAIGPSGPVDPGFTLLAVTTPTGEPLAVLANYSQHYYGSPLLSSDYYGRFATHLAEALQADSSFVAIVSQGTSGDQMWMDYGAPAREIGYDAYARELATQAEELFRRIRFTDHAPLRMAEARLPLRYRTPDPARLAWARNVAQALGERLASNLPEIYAWEAIHLHERQQTELKLQAIRIGEFAIATLPNEVFAITGLKLKLQSPLPLTMNVSLANGAEGYIPPPEQHVLGGYTTWPARTAGLEVEAEPRIVATLLNLLEQVSGRPRRSIPEPTGPYTRAVLDSHPTAYWRLNEIVIPTAHDASGNGRHATFEKGIALYLPGPGSGTGVSPTPALTPSQFSGDQINRSIHFAGGRLRTPIQPGERYTVEFWLWNGLPDDARAVTGYLVSHGIEGDPTAAGEHLGIGGTHQPDLAGRLFLFNGNQHDEILAGRTRLVPKAWYHVALVRDGHRFRVHLNGQTEPEIDGTFRQVSTAPGRSLLFGGRTDGLYGLEGRLDEIAVHDRILTPAEIAAHFQASGLTPPQSAAAPPPPPPAPASQPLSPRESLARIHVPAGFAVDLVAAEPLVLDPVAIDWDVAGNLWVVEMADYPMGLDGRGKPGGRVRILRDTDNDGRPDQSTTFAEGLSFPTGLITWRDGVLVTAAPEILWLRDTDRDGKADQRTVLVSGLLEGNQQLRANGLRWGLDGWIYCAAGGHHIGHGSGNRLRTPKGEFAVGSRDFRFKPDTGELEPESGPSQFGRNRDDWGNWFGTQNIRPLWHYVLSDRYLRRNPHVPSPDPTHLVVTPLSPVVYAASEAEKRYHSFNEAGHFTSACAGTPYQDELLFGPSRDTMQAFTCEPFHNLVQRNVVTESGVSFTATHDRLGSPHDFFASEDRWCRPVMTRTGPDGALWVVDMYRYMIEHPDWLPEKGKADLLPHYRLGEDRGRLYRIHPVGKPPRPTQPLASLSPAALVDSLRSPNGWTRDKAHQLLLWKPDPATYQPLEKLAAGGPDSPAVARLHALWILDTLNRANPANVAAALKAPEPGLRINALILAERHPTLVASVAPLVDDPSPRVRLQLACTLGQWDSAEAGQLLARLALRDHAEPFLRAAVLSSALPHANTLATAVPQGSAAQRDAYSEGLTRMALGLGHRDMLARLLQPALESKGDRITAAQAREATRFLSLLALRQVTPESLQQTSDRLARTLEGLGRMANWARAAANPQNPGYDTETRIAAGTFLARHSASRADALPLLATWLAPTQSGELQRAAIDALAATGSNDIAGPILRNWPSLTPAARNAALDVLTGREPWAVALVERSLELQFAPPDAARRDRLTRHKSARVRELAAKWFSVPPARAEVLARFQPAVVLSASGIHRDGMATFVRLCSPCHKLGETGKRVGPDPASFATQSPEKLLANILIPNADIQPGYSAYVARLRDGSELSGVITSDTGNSLILTLTDGSTRTLLRSEITSLEDTGRSLMPEGLETGLTVQDMANLLAFLRQPSAAK
jgi:putative membrane-bound dehydrogenase-like protein